MFRARVRNFDAAETLVITDEEDCALSCKSLDLPVVGFEHDNVRLSCSEIILSLEDLSAAGKKLEAIPEVLTSSRERLSDIREKLN